MNVSLSDGLFLLMQKAGLTRADAARDAMRAFGFAERLINVCIKELLEV